MEKVEKVHILVVFVFFDKIIQLTSNLMKFLRSRSFGDLGQRSHVSCPSTFSKGFFQMGLLFQFHLNFIFSLLTEGGGGWG